MRCIRSYSLLVAVTFAVLGCELGLLGSSAVSIDTSDSFRAEVDGLEIYLEAPEKVGQHEPFQIAYNVINHRPGSVIISTPDSCLGFVSVLDEQDKAAGMKGVAHGCYAALTDHEIAAGDTAKVVRDARAEHVMTDEPIDAGMYEVRGRSKAYAIDGDSASFPTVTRTLLVSD